MKKVLSLFLVFAMLCSLLTFATVATSAAGIVEIEDNATTVTIDGVTYTVVRDEDGLKAIASGLSGKYILANNITLTSSWSSIGTFTGVLDGNGYTISGMKIEVANASGWAKYGLFKQVNNATIKNLTLNGSINVTFTASSGGLEIGAFVGTDQGGSTISNCVSNVKITAASTTKSVIMGGIVGQAHSKDAATYQNTSLINCQNNGAITLTSVPVNVTCEVGGICGQTNENASIQNCINTGAISAGQLRTWSGIAGIVGVFKATTGDVISDCVNTGSVTSTDTLGAITPENYTGGSQYCIGGIAGDGSGNFTVSNCSNSGAITANARSFVGGIYGSPGNGTVTIQNCANLSGGEIKANGTNSFAGGIVGQTGATSLTITGCVNAVNITAGSEGVAGGILGQHDGGSDVLKILYSANLGTAKGGWDCAGILGKVNGQSTVENTINYCFNSGSGNGAIIGAYRFTSSGGDPANFVAPNWEYNYSTNADKPIFQKYMVATGTAPTISSETSKIINSTDDDYAEIVAILNTNLTADAFRLCGDEIVPVVRATSSYTPTTLAVQDTTTTKAEEDLLMVRLLSVISGEATDYTALGFLVTTKANDVERDVNRDCDCNYLYTAVIGGGESYAATTYGGDYIYAYTFSDVPTSGTATFVVTPYTVAGGICYDGTTYTVNYTEGALAE